MVLFVTGLCDKNCFYCPISEERKKKQVFANEQPVYEDSDIIREAKRMDALGTGITGGEPLLEKETTLHYIQLLKNEFGKKHHIHLYTASHPDANTIRELAEAGLDEIRFHPPQHLWGKVQESPYRKSMEEAKYAGMEVGLEIPTIEGVKAVVRFAEKNDYFINLNELEFSDTNAEELKKMGYVLVNDISNAVKGSRDVARKAILESVRIHFCSSRYKDAIQLRQRLIRTASTINRPLDMITEDGTIVFGIIHTEKPEEIISKLQDFDIPEEFYEIKEKSIEIAAWVLEEIAHELKNATEIVEKYPIKDGIIVETMPL